MLMLACYASQNLIKSFLRKNQQFVRLCKYEGKLDCLITYLGNNCQRDFLPYITLSLEINSRQFTNLNISDFSKKRFLLNSNAFKFMYNMYLTICVQLHSKLNSFSASASAWYTSCWKTREKNCFVKEHSSSLTMQKTYKDQAGVLAVSHWAIQIFSVKGFFDQLMQMILHLSHIICA